MENKPRVNLRKPERVSKQEEQRVLREITPEHICDEIYPAPLSNRFALTPMLSNDAASSMEQGNSVYHASVYYEPPHTGASEVVKLDQRATDNYSDENRITVLYRNESEVDIPDETLDVQMPRVLQLLLRSLRDNVAWRIFVYDTMQGFDANEYVIACNIKDNKDFTIQGDHIELMQPVRKHKSTEYDEVYHIKLHSPMLDKFARVLAYLASPRSTVEHMLRVLKQAIASTSLPWFSNYYAWLTKAVSGNTQWLPLASEWDLTGKSIGMPDYLICFICNHTLRLLCRSAKTPSAAPLSIADVTLLWVAEEYAQRVLPVKLNNSCIDNSAIHALVLYNVKKNDVLQKYERGWLHKHCLTEIDGNTYGLVCAAGGLALTTFLFAIFNPWLLLGGVSLFLGTLTGYLVDKGTMEADRDNYISLIEAAVAEVIRGLDGDLQRLKIPRKEDIKHASEE